MIRDQSDPQHPRTPPAWALSGRALRRLMRQHHVTIRVLAQRMQIPMTRVRYRRQHGIAEWHRIRDWVEAITSVDPGAVPHPVHHCPATSSTTAARRDSRRPSGAQPCGERSPSTERHAMITPSPLMSPEAYRQAGGGCCPVCRSGQIVGESFDTDAALVWQRLHCLDCSAVWTAVYALQGYEALECPAPVPQEEQARLLREVLRNRDLNPHDVLDLADGVAAALLALPAIQEKIQATWHEEQHRAAEEADEHEEDGP